MRHKSPTRWNDFHLYHMNAFCKHLLEKHLLQVMFKDKMPKKRQKIVPKRYKPKSESQ